MRSLKVATRACSSQPLLVRAVGVDATQPADHQHDHHHDHDRVAAEPHDRAAGVGVGQRVDRAGRAATIATACVPCSNTMPVNVSTAIATASSSHRAGCASRHRIGSSPDDQHEELAADQHVHQVLDLAGPGVAHDLVHQPGEVAADDHDGVGRERDRRRGEQRQRPVRGRCARCRSRRRGGRRCERERSGWPATSSTGATITSARCPAMWAVNSTWS